MIVFTKIHDGQVSDERRIIAFKDLYLPSHELLVTFRKQLAKIVDDFIKLVFFFFFLDTKLVILCVRFFEQNV